jgi:serine phosphatase RsbU (regulator of sigma subunit)
VRRRGRGMSLAASMQWDLLPPLTLRATHAVVTGLLEPAYEVAGDAFDYALNGDRLDVGLFDGMGHGIGSSMLTNLAVGAYRHARREGQDVPAMHQAVDAAVAEQYDRDAFVTGVFARLQVDTGALTWTNAGHPVPLLLRDRRVVGPLPCEPSPPFGLAGVVPTVQVEALEPGDTVLLYTDGVTEAGAPQRVWTPDDLVEVVSGCARGDAQQLVDAVAEATLEDLVGPPRDDIAILALRIAPA